MDFIIIQNNPLNPEVHVFHAMYIKNRNEKHPLHLPHGRDFCRQ